MGFLSAVIDLLIWGAVCLLAYQISRLRERIEDLERHEL